MIHVTAFWLPDRAATHAAETRLMHDAMQEFKNIWHALLSMFQYMTSGIDISPFYKSSNPEAATLLLVLYMFIMVGCCVFCIRAHNGFCTLCKVPSARLLPRMYIFNEGS